jgi:hypothetical protein
MNVLTRSGDENPPEILAVILLILIEFPILESLNVNIYSGFVLAHQLAGVVNSTRTSSYVVAEVSAAGGPYELRVNGVGDEACFVWNCGDGFSIGNSFTSLGAGEISRFKSRIG